MANKPKSARWIPVSDEEILRQARLARRRTARAFAIEPRATAARYDRSRGAVIVELSNGAFFGFPTRVVKELAAMTPRELEEVEVSPIGEALHWPRLDIDLRVPPVMLDMFGTRTWMRELGRVGGRSRSPAKARASRRNGALGGRPRKAASAPKRSTP